MEKLYSLKNQLMKELEGFAGKELSSPSLDIVMKLAGTVKNISKIIQLCEEEDEGGSYLSRGSSYSRGGNYSYARDVEPGRDYSYRGRRGAPRDSMGRYSGDGYSRHSGRETAQEIRQLMAEAPDEETRKEMERLVQMLEQR